MTRHLVVSHYSFVKCYCKSPDKFIKFPYVIGYAFIVGLPFSPSFPSLTSSSPFSSPPLTLGCCRLPTNFVQIWNILFLIQFILSLLNGELVDIKVVYKSLSADRNYHSFVVFAVGEFAHHYFVTSMFTSFESSSIKVSFCLLSHLQYFVSSAVYICLFNWAI